MTKDAMLRWLIAIVIIAALISLIKYAVAHDAQQRENERLARIAALADTLNNAGVIGEKPLLSTGVSQGINGSLSGGSFFFAGSVTGKIQSEPYLSFQWKTNGEKVFITTLPCSKFEFQLNEAAQNPSIQFIFEQEPNWRVDETHEEPNYYTMEDINLLKKVVVKISSSQLRQISLGVNKPLTEEKFDH